MFTMDEVRGKARPALIEKLCKMKDPRAALGLIQVISSPKPEDKADVQDRAFKALYRLRNRAIVPDLVRMIDSDQEQQQGYGIRLLGRTLGRGSFDRLKGFLRSQGSTLEAAVRAMGETADPRAAKLLRETLQRAGPRSDISVFIRMSLIRLGQVQELKPLLMQYQGIIDEAFRKKLALRYIDRALTKQRYLRRIKYLWSVQRELREYFSDFEPKLIPPLVAAVETTDANATKQLVFDLVPKMVDGQRAPRFAGMLHSRYVGMRRLIVRRFVELGDPKLRALVVESIRKYLTAADWDDRRYAIMYGSLLPEAERMQALQRAAEDKVIWVRAEAVRELGRLRSPEALALIRKVRDGTTDGELRFICRCALRGTEEDLCGLR